MAKYTFINKGGQHVLGDGTKVNKGETFESDVDLRKDFPNKFELVGDGASTPVNAKGGKDTDDADDADTGKSGAKDKAPKDAPEDVTSDFKVDEEGSLSVIKEKGKWNVYEDGDETPINEKPLAKGKVQPFIDDYLEDDED